MTDRAAAFPRRYPVAIVSVTDGDTVRAFLDRGGDDWWLTAVRLHGCACREITDPGGPEARDYTAQLLGSITPPTVADLLLSHWRGTCQAVAWDKYAGRIQGLIWLPGDDVDVSTHLIQAGYAAPWDGRGLQPKPPWPLPEEGRS